MTYLPMMNDDEVKYVCSVIPQKDVSNYFQHNPKEFAKIFPGFRASTIGRYNIPDLLFKYRAKDFIASFLEKGIEVWLVQIQEHFDECEKNGKSQELAYIDTLARSFFAENVSLYFKLIDKECSGDFLSLLSSAVSETKKALGAHGGLSDELDLKNATVMRLEENMAAHNATIKSLKEKQQGYISEIKSLKHEAISMAELKATVLSKEEAVAALYAEIVELKRTKKDLITELSATKINQRQLEAQIREEMEKRQTAMKKKQTAALKPLRPKDISEFEDYLGFNFESIGISAGANYLRLLKKHLSSTLFQGAPIVINRSVGVPLMKCVANSLIGSQSIDTLTYSKDVSRREIDEFISGDNRLVCLDGFIGQYDEIALLSLFERNKNKIIFLTNAYDRTMRYIPYEFFRYCHYLNLNRIPALYSGTELTEDSSVLEEVTADIAAVVPDARFSLLLKEILLELGFGKGMAMKKCAFVSNEDDLCRALVFDILPYCVDVFQISPFAVSERLVKYAGEKGRCAHKQLFWEWFA